MTVRSFKKILIVSGALFFAHSVSYAPSAWSNCTNDQLKHSTEEFALPALPQAIPKTPDDKIKTIFKVTDRARIRQNAHVLNLHHPDPKRSLETLKDGTYIYLMDNRGNVAILDQDMSAGAHVLDSAQTLQYASLSRDYDSAEKMYQKSLDEADKESAAAYHEIMVRKQNEMKKLEPKVMLHGAEFMGSHIGLLQAFDGVYGKDFQIVAAGEMVRRFDRTVGISNNSNTFHGNKPHLDYAVAAFRRLHLPIDLKKTKIQDYPTLFRLAEGGEVNDRHSSAPIEVASAIHVSRNAHLQVVLANTRRIMKEADQLGLPQVMAKWQRAPEEEQGMLNAFIYLYGQWMQPAEGPTERTLNVIEGQGFEKFIKILNLAEKHILAK